MRWTETRIVLLLHNVKAGKAYLSRLEDIIAEGGYVVRYERGNFRSGYCILKETRMVLINNFLPLDGRISTMTELVRLLPLQEGGLTDRSRKLFHEIRQPLPVISFDPPATP